MKNLKRKATQTHRGRDAHSVRKRQVRCLGFESMEPRRLLASDVQLVTDINAVHSNLGSFPQPIVVVGTTLFFTARDETHDSELWKSDGTAASTALVKDIRVGSSSNIHDMTNVNGTLYFVAEGGPNGAELWKSDGSTYGTVLLKEFVAGVAGPSVTNLTNVNGTLCFQANDGVNGGELWKSDGTAAGTVMVKDIRPGIGSSAPTNLTNLNGTLYFSANDGTNGTELWKSDGTSSGTILVSDIQVGSGSASPRSITILNGILYFSANDGVRGDELWKSDGTASGTTLIKDIRAGVGVANLFNLTNVNGTLYFSANDGVNGNELWKSDGSAAGTALVKDISAGSGGAYPSYFANVNGSLYFSSMGSLWKSDGTSFGTVNVKFLGSGGANPRYLTQVNDMLYFNANSFGNGEELWKSDGTFAGTVIVKEIFPGSSSAIPRFLTNMNGTLYFVATDGSNGHELWRSDGTDSGTVMVDDIRTGSGAATPQNLTNVNGTLYFSASDGIHGTELWKSDGTPSGTVLVKDIFAGIGSSSPLELTNVDGTLYFQATDGINGTELWKSDGTASGTVLVKDIRGGGVYSSANPRFLTNVNGLLYFRAFDGVNGSELWQSDGTTAGTFMVMDIRAGSAGAYPSWLTNVNGVLHFTADNGIHGNELWRSDGSAIGTWMLKDSFPGPFGSSQKLINIGGMLYFNSGISLWKSDGSSAGTVLVKDVSAGIGGLSLSYPTNVNGTLYFSVQNAATLAQIWKSDGTSDGTVLVKDIRSGTGASSTAYLTNVNGTLYFRADDGSNGAELWKSDGTTLGTGMVKDILPGTGVSVYSLKSANDTLYFQANDGIHGYELWKSDGTEAGTVFVADLTGDSGDSHPSNLTVVGDNLFLTATTETVGTELFKMTLVNQAPVSSSLSNTIVAENNLLNAVVGSFTTTDPDVGDTFIYSLVPGTGSADNASFSIVGNQLQANTSFDFELQSSYSIRVRTTDAAGLFIEQSFSITITDVNEIKLYQGTSGNDAFLVDIGAVNVLVRRNNVLIDTLAVGSFIEIDGLAGIDSLVIQDNTGLGNTIQLNGATFSMNTTSISWTNMESSAVDGFAGDDVFVVNGTLGATALRGGNDNDTFMFGTGSSTSLPVDGGLGNDLLLGSNVANLWSINGTNAGSLAGVASFSQVEGLIGGIAADTFRFIGTGNLTGRIDGGADADVLDYSARAAAVSINLANAIATGTTGIASIESALGSQSPADILVGRNVANSWRITGSAEGNLNNYEFTFTGFENLTGGSARDQFTFASGGSLPRTINGGANGVGERDQVNYQEIAGPLLFNLNATAKPLAGSWVGIEEVVGTAAFDTLQGSNSTNSWSLTGADSGTLGSLSFVNIENLTGGTLSDSFSVAASGALRGTIFGGAGIDTLVGANANNVWLVQGENTGLLNGVPYQAIENLTGGTATDTFVISPSGSVSGVLNGGAGVADRLDFSVQSSFLVLNLQTRSLQGGGTFTGVEQIVGSFSNGDLLIGPNATTAWTISGMNAGTAGSIQFFEFESIQGGIANDTFTLPVTGTLTGVILGGDGIDTLVGPSPGFGSVTEWNVNAPSGGYLRDVDFVGIENLSGGSNLDRFLFSGNGAVTGTISGGASGIGERDQVSYEAVAGPITIDLQARTQPRAGLLSGIEELIGTTDVDELRGLNAANTWSLTGANTGTVGTFRFVGFEGLRGGTLADTFSFVAGGNAVSVDGGDGVDRILGPNANTDWNLQLLGQGTIGTSNFVAIENLSGGTAVDTFNIGPGGSLAGALSGGTTGRNVLSYATWSSAVSVNLATRVASGIAGQVTNFTIVQGGSGNDQLTGNSSLGTILLGMSGDDSLLGGSGRDLLIGGFGGDLLNGVSGDDLLISGATVYDNDFVSLSSIFDEWSTTSRNYQTRVNNLRGIGAGPRLNGDLFLQTTPVQTLSADPGSLDQLIGGLGQDWFITDDAADITDQVLTGLFAELRDEVMAPPL